MLSAVSQFIAISTFFSLLCWAQTSPLEQKLLKRFPWYHTTSMISEELYKIAAVSSFIQVKKERIANTHHYLDIVMVKKGNPKYKFFLLAGEHARELISPESALHFVKALSGKFNEVRELVDNVLKHTEFHVIVNGNPLSRMKVEEGDYCLRVNENGVDLNRNWGDHWRKKALNGRDTNPGSRPFSEPEVQIFRNIVKYFNPHTFISVHSGTLGMYMPFAYTSKFPSNNKQNMLTLLKQVDSMYCKCPFGPAGAEVGYHSYGTCLDYVYDKFKVPFSYAFEIYTNKERRELLHTAWEEALSRISIQSLTSVRSPLAFSLFERKSRKYRHSNSNLILTSAMDCFQEFNPSNEEEYKTTLNNWTKAYLTVADQAAKKLNYIESI